MCRDRLVEPPTGDDPAAIIGEECHIVARSGSGPRGDEPPPLDGLNSYANLVLLCPTDHRKIDAQPGRYPAAVLRRIKAAHEAWVLEQLAQPIRVQWPAGGGADPLLPVAASVVSAVIWDVFHDPAYRPRFARGLPASAVHGLAVKAITEPLFGTLQRIGVEHRIALATFLDSNEVRQLIAQACKSRLAPGRGGRSLAGDLQLFWRAWHGRVSPDVDLASIARALIQGWDAAIPTLTSGASGEGELGERAQRLTTERIAGLESAVGLVAAEGQDLALRADVLEDTLRRYAAFRYRDINISSGTESLVSVSVEHLYVPPRFRVDDVLVSYEELLEESFRLVVLGDPGTGKSAFAAKACVDLAGASVALSGGLRPVGLVVRLYRAASRIAAGEQSPFDALRAGLDDVVRNEFQIGDGADTLEYLLRAGRIAVVFDGLDELPTRTDRLAIRDALDHFALRYPQAPMIITTRVVGYADAPLDPMRFRVARIEGFNPSDVADYAERWFGRSVNDTERAATLARGFVSVTEDLRVRDLCSNPFLLSLLCAMYERTGMISVSRPAIYEYLAELLYKQWDVQREVVRRPLSTQIRPAIERLAWVMLKEPTKAGGMTASEAVDEITAYLSSRHYAEQDEAREIAALLIERLRGRAWVLTEIGVDKHGDGLYAFTHRTFLEYFAAKYIVGASPGLSDTAGEVLRLAMAGSEDVAQMVVSLAAQSPPHGAGEFVRALRSAASTAEERGAAELLIEWIARNLE